MPVVFARKLLPGTRDPHNVDHLRRLVQNGADQWPGPTGSRRQELRVARSAPIYQGSFGEATRGHRATITHNTGTKSRPTRVDGDSVL